MSSTKFILQLEVIFSLRAHKTESDASEKVRANAKKIVKRKPNIKGKASKLPSVVTSGTSMNMEAAPRLQKAVSLPYLLSGEMQKMNEREVTEVVLPSLAHPHQSARSSHTSC